MTWMGSANTEELVQLDGLVGSQSSVVAGENNCTLRLGRKVLPTDGSVPIWSTLIAPLVKPPGVRPVAGLPAPMLSGLPLCRITVLESRQPSTRRLLLKGRV